MTRTWIVILGICLLATEALAQWETPALKTPKQRASYAIGADIAANFKRMQLDLDLDLLVKGLKDGFAGQGLLISDKEIQEVLAAFQDELQAKQVQAAQGAAGDNKKEGDTFLAENKKKGGVVALPSGLQYKILKAGSGKKPADTDTVECNYRGTLINGTEFDSSARTGKPATFRVSGVIAGWREALKLMPVGSKWQLFVPSQLAYGSSGVGRDIGPNATLIFEVELVGIK